MISGSAEAGQPGNGKANDTLLLLPGMMCDARLFAAQLAALSDHCQVLVAAPADLAAFSIEDMAKRVLQRAPAGPLNVAGLSMGGIVAMAMAAMAPGRIARLALLDTNHLADPANRRDIRNRQIDDVRAGRLREVLIDEMKPAYLAMRHRDDQQLLQRLLDMGLSLGEETFIAQSLALRDRADYSAVLQAYTGPALVLCGAEDRLCPPERHRAMASLLRDVVVSILPGTGHLSTLESPAAVNTALLEWLQRNPSRTVA